MTVISFDYGSKKIGVAVGQKVTMSAQPLCVINNNGALFVEIDRIVTDWNPGCFVVGEPVLADGKIHPLEKNIQIFMKKLNLRYNRKIFRENEALTSFEAEQYGQGAGDYGKMDAYAAAIILESWMRSNIDINGG